LYVGNLPWDTTEDKLRTLFADYGAVSRVKVVCDHVTGRPRGFGFVTMDNVQAAQRAIQHLNGMLYRHRNLVVSEATSPTRGQRPPRSPNAAVRPPQDRAFDRYERD
jgi:RNA recognition motif-containing protein